MLENLTYASVHGFTTISETLTRESIFVFLTETCKDAIKMWVLFKVDRKVKVSSPNFD